MKKNIKIMNLKGQRVDKEITYIPARYIMAIILTIMETLIVIGIVVACTYFIPYFYLAVLATQAGVVIAIIASNDNPDYKIPWLLFVLIIPIAGFMLYFLFYRRKLSSKHINRLNKISNQLAVDDTTILNDLETENPLIYSTFNQIKNISHSHIYRNTELKYYELGEYMFKDMLIELKRANNFIFLEYFIIEHGTFWDSILEILIEKAANGVEVKLIYDDVGCMTTLSGNYYKKLRKYNIMAIPFARLRGQADNEFNNRSHRKIMVIDGKVGFTGGVNIADEYINERVRFGHWKDTGIKLEGEAVDELTNLFLIDYQMCFKRISIDTNKYFVNHISIGKEYIMPFGDGPNPQYSRRVGKTVLLNMLYQASKYVYMTSPYLIIDNELAQAIENTALRGIDVRIILPHIPDKKMVFGMTRSFYKRFIEAGVKIYEYEPGFIHAKSYISDDMIGMIGTINLDYRSLVHHFENGVLIYNSNVILDVKKDFMDTVDKSIEVNLEDIRNGIIKRFIRSIVKIFSPLL